MIKVATNSIMRKRDIESVSEFKDGAEDTPEVDPAPPLE
jgi:hypothetical protein